jgi:hypothetical protein
MSLQQVLTLLIVYSVDALSCTTAPWITTLASTSHAQQRAAAVAPTAAAAATTAAAAAAAAADAVLPAQLNLVYSNSYTPLYTTSSEPHSLRYAAQVLLHVSAQRDCFVVSCLRTK